MTEPPADAPATPPELACPRCGAPHDRYQEYCLNCGLRLSSAYVPAAGSRTIWSRTAWSRESPYWLWAALAALLLVGLISGGIVAALAATDEQERPRRAERPGATSTVAVLTDVTTSNLPPTLTVVPTTTFVPTGTTTVATTTTRSTEAVIAWPPGKRGYTVVVASVPKAEGRGTAEARAREAIDNGVQEVGILDSGDYTSLNPGYWVVFAGVHDTEQEAENALPAVRNAGYPVAYIREITP